MPTYPKLESIACLRCNHRKSNVVDTRPKSKKGVLYNYIKRRRKCLNCGHIQTTYESTDKPRGHLLRLVIELSEARKKIDREIDLLIGKVEDMNAL